MPVLYRYFGLVVFFYSREHLPIHVHGSYQNTEQKAEIEVRNGEVAAIRLLNVVGRKPLPPTYPKRFAKLLEAKAPEIVQKWMDFFVLNKEIEAEKITIELQ